MLVVRPIFLKIYPEADFHVEGIADFILREMGGCLAQYGETTFLYRGCCIADWTGEAAGRSFYEWLDELVLPLDKQFENIASDLSVSYCARVETFCAEHTSFIAAAGKHDELESLKNNVVEKAVRPRVLRPVIPSATSLAALDDRVLGSRLLSLALSSTSFSAALSGYVRLFEAAFDINHNALKGPLHRFLQANDYGIQKRESDCWIDLRHGASHGKSGRSIYFDADVIGYAERAKLAAYDVLFNKKHWGKNCPERRSVDHVVCGCSSDGSVVLKPSAQMVMKMIGLDYFRRFGVKNMRFFDYIALLRDAENYLSVVPSSNLVTERGLQLM